MVEILLFCIMIFLAVLGLADIIHSFKIYIKYPQKLKSNYLLVILNEDNAEEQVKYLADKLQWYGKKFANGVIAVYNDSVDIKPIINLVKRYNIILCRADELSLMLN